jgi:hypothetical protein
VITERPSGSHKANDASAELSYSGASGPTSVVALPIAPVPTTSDVSDPIRELFHNESGKGNSRTDSLASALTETYRGNSQPSPPPAVYSVNLDPGRSRLPDDGDEQTALSPWARAAALTIAQMLEQLEDSPHDVDLLAENLPLEGASMEHAIEHYLDEVDGLGGILTDLLTSERLRPWLHGAALAAVGSVLAHRLRRKAKSDAREDAGRYEPESPWSLDWHLEET